MLRETKMNETRIPQPKHGEAGALIWAGRRGECDPATPGALALVRVPPAPVHPRETVLLSEPLWRVQTEWGD